MFHYGRSCTEDESDVVDKNIAMLSKYRINNAMLSKYRITHNPAGHQMFGLRSPFLEHTNPTMPRYGESAHVRTIGWLDAERTYREGI